MKIRSFTSTIRQFILSVILIFAAGNSFAQDLAASRWVDSVYQQLSLDERIAQLMIVRANQPDKPYRTDIAELIEHYNIGGVCFFKGAPKSQVYQSNKWQQKARTPLFISIDAEWGLAMRLGQTVTYPYQMSLGAIQNDEQIYEMGCQIGEQCKRMGIHINFAPVADVNSNPDNPVIGMRSFGNIPEMVGKKALAYARGLQDMGIITTAKHFPGHGDTQNDSHYTLPILNHNRAHFDSIELKPFKYLIQNGIQGVMTAHLHVPALDDSKSLPSCLSPKIVTGILKNELGFSGLIVTDGLDMKGVTSVQPSGKIELMALQAGNDILLLPENVPLAISTIKVALENGELDPARIEESCKKVLMFKYKAGLNQYRPALIENLENDLNRPEYNDLVQTLYNYAITVLRNQESVLPLQSGSGEWALVSIGKKAENIDVLENKFPGLKSFTLLHNADKAAVELLKEQLKPYKNVIVDIRKTHLLANKNYGISETSITFVNQLSKDKRLVFNLFAAPYALDFFKINDNFAAILIGYQDTPEAVKALRQVLVGRVSPTGKLPVSLKSGFEAGEGLSFEPVRGEKKGVSEPVFQPQITGEGEQTSDNFFFGS